MASDRLSCGEWLAQLMSNPEQLRALVGDSPEAARGAHIVASAAMKRLSVRYTVTLTGIVPRDAGQIDAHKTKLADPALVDGETGPLDDSDNRRPRRGVQYSEGGGI